MIAWDMHTDTRRKRLARSQPLTKRQLRRMGMALLALSVTAAVLILAVQFNWFWLS